MALTLLRHSEPEIGAGICYGQSDIPARPIEEARLRDLVSMLPGSILRIDTSPLLRCRTVADRIAPAFGLIAQPDARLLEIDFGHWELQSWDDIPRHEIDAWADDVEGARPHGGESVAQMVQRVRGYLKECAGLPGNVLAITHLGVVRCAHAALGRTDAFAMELGYLQFTTLEPKDLR